MERVSRKGGDALVWGLFLGLAPTGWSQGPVYFMMCVGLVGSIKCAGSRLQRY